jgi:hypothetical protein
MSRGGSLIRVSDPGYQRMSLIKKQLEEVRGRQVSFAEVLEDLLTVWERLAEVEAADR